MFELRFIIDLIVFVIKFMLLLDLCLNMSVVTLYYDILLPMQKQCYVALSVTIKSI
jgi:hypothetical protein